MLVPKKYSVTQRHTRFIEALLRTGREGGDRGEVVRRALDRWIEIKIAEGKITDADGGAAEELPAETDKT